MNNFGAIDCTLIIRIISFTWQVSVTFLPLGMTHIFFNFHCHFLISNIQIVLIDNIIVIVIIIIESFLINIVSSRVKTVGSLNYYLFCLYNRLRSSEHIFQPTACCGQKPDCSTEGISTSKKYS